ncbi:uncharacterized protein LOC103308433 isoform X2 [Acyrthosiphon pisum]|uniref:Uncharacterized protein n=1 Tax=Acyrthosiphon pisum TaxID=7029 RepID=A0A8R2JP88_ACYPI|nr:uncharacterized protein LOC103308433 isoform X2 [Acyrthosiphon pisum]
MDKILTEKTDSIISDTKDETKKLITTKIESKETTTHETITEKHTGEKTDLIKSDSVESIKSDKCEKDTDKPTSDKAIIPKSVSKDSIKSDKSDKDLPTVLKDASKMDDIITEKTDSIISYTKDDTKKLITTKIESKETTTHETITEKHTGEKTDLIKSDSVESIKSDKSEKDTDKPTSDKTIIPKSVSNESIRSDKSEKETEKPTSDKTIVPKLVSKESIKSDKSEKDTDKPTSEKTHSIISDTKDDSFESVKLYTYQSSGIFPKLDSQSDIPDSFTSSVDTVFNDFIAGKCIDYPVRSSDNIKTVTSLDSFKNEFRMSDFSNVENSNNSFPYETEVVVFDKMSEKTNATVDVLTDHNVYQNEDTSVVSKGENSCPGLNRFGNLKVDTLTSISICKSSNELKDSSIDKSNFELSESLCEFMNVTSTTLGHFEFDHSLNETEDVDNTSNCENVSLVQDTAFDNTELSIEGIENSLKYHKLKNFDICENYCMGTTSQTDHGASSNNLTNVSNTFNVISSSTNEENVSKKSYGIRKTDITKSGFSSSKKTKDLGSFKNEFMKKDTKSIEIIKPEVVGVMRSSSLRSNSSTISKSYTASNKSKVMRSESTKIVRSSFESKTSIQNVSATSQSRSRSVGIKSNLTRSSNSLRTKADTEMKDFRSLNSTKKTTRNLVSSSASEFETTNNREHKSSTFISKTHSSNQSLTKKSINARQEFNTEIKNNKTLHENITSIKVDTLAKISNESSTKSSTKSITTINKKNFSKIEHISSTKLVDSKRSSSNISTKIIHPHESQEKNTKLSVANRTLIKKLKKPEIEKYRKTSVNEKLKNKQVVEVPETSSKSKVKSYMASTESRNRKLENISHAYSKTSDASTKYQRIISDKQKKIPTSPSRIPIKDNSNKTPIKKNLSLLDTRSSSVSDPRVLSAPSQRSGFDFMSSPRKISPTSLPVSPAHRCLKADKKISSVLITSEVFSRSSDRASSVELVYEQPKRSPCSSMSEQQPASVTESVSLDDEETTHSSTSDTNRDSEINSNVFDDSSIELNLVLGKPNQFLLSDEMSEASKKSLPQIAITAYESNEEDIEVTNLLNGINEENNVKIHEPRSVSPKPIRHKSKIILKSPLTTHLQKSLSPGLSDLNSCTDVEVMSDSDEEKYYVRTPNLTPGPIDYFILTDIEDLSEDEGYEKNNKVIDELTDTEHFTDDKGIINEVEYTEQPLESMPYFPQPHREILFHSKDGTVSALSPTEESNPIWLKSPNEEVKGFESEEEIITVEEHGDTESYIKNNNNTYYHDIDVGVVESVETVKQDRCKHKYRNRVLTSKKNITPEAECGKKRYRNKNRCNSEIEESFEKRSEENKKKTLSKFMSEPTLSNVTIPKQNQNIKTNKINNQENNNTFVIHDNRNGFSISIDFQSQNSVLLSVGRDYGNLSMRWFNDGITTGDEANQTQQQNAKSIDNSERSPELTTNANNLALQNSVDKIPPKPNPRHSIDSSITSSLDEDDVNYTTKKQFWEEITKTNQPPLPKPRYSISLPINNSKRPIMNNASLELFDNSFGASDNAEVPEMINKPMTSDQTTEKNVVSEFTCLKSDLLDEQPCIPQLEEYNVVKETKRLDSEAEYIIKYGEESLAFENEGFQEEDVFDNKDSAKREYSQSSNKKKMDTKTRSMSLPSHQTEHISSKKYIQQIKPQMEGIQMEQESSPEHKSLKNTTRQQSPSQEVLINRQIHKHIFSNELDEQIDSLIPEEKYLGLKCEKSVSMNSIHTSSDKMTGSTSEKSITKTESAESSVLDDLPEEIKINKIISKQSKDKNSSSLTQDHIDEIPSDTCSFIEEKEKSILHTESIDSSMIDDEIHNEIENRKEMFSQTLPDRIIHTPEEHIPDTIWEVTQLGTDDQELENADIKDQCIFHQNFVQQVDSIDSLENPKKEMTGELARNIAEQLINEIEIELSKRHDVLANLHHLMMSPDQFQQLENSGYLDMAGEDLQLKIMESVLAKKSRDQLKSISKHDTITSSIEITDEDLKSSGFEIEYEGSTKSRINEHNIPESDYEKSKTNPTNKDPDILIEFGKSSHDKKEEYYKEAKDNLIIEAYIREQQNENDKRIESQKKDIFSYGQDDHKLISQKHYKDTKTDVFENKIINENNQTIETQELGSHYNSNDDNSIHNIHNSSKISNTEKGKIVDEHVMENDSHEIHSKECFEVENKQNIHGRNVNIITNEKHVDTLIKDFDDERIKEEQHSEQTTDDGLEICNIDREEYRATSCIFKETVNDYKNEVTLIKDFEPCSSKSLIKQLSAESFPSKDNSVHSPTSPSSSSIDIREEKRVNFDAVVFRKPDSININKLSTKKPADSSSSDSHYHSFDLTSSSRPCSSDVDGLLAGSSEYESAVSVPSNEYHTAISSLSSRESMKSLDSESSGNLASVENSEASETLIASTGDLDFDQDGTNSILEDEDKIEPYEQEIPMHIIRGESLPIIAELTEMKYSSMYKTQPFSQPAINSEKNMQKMKRSHEMTFHPMPKHITSDSLSDSSSHEEKLFSSEDASMSISSTEGQAIQTVVEAMNGFPESGTCSFSFSDENTKSVETSTIQNEDEHYDNENKCVTIISSSVPTEYGICQNVCTQMTTKSEEVQKKGHRRNSSSFSKILVEDLDIIDNKGSVDQDQLKEFTVCNQHLEHIQDKSKIKLENLSSKDVHDLTSEKELSSIHDKHNFDMHGSISDKHSFEHIDDIAESDAAFQMVPHVSPAIPASLPPTIPEDPFSEDEDDLLDDSTDTVPNIMITEHMAPLVDRGFHYPDLDLEAKELEIKTSTPQTPASISSKESSDTDQGREYIINEDYDPHEEPSWTGEEQTILEKVEETEEKESVSLSESFELVDNIEEKLESSDDEFVVIEEIGKEAKEEDSEGKAIQIQRKTKIIHKNVSNTGSPQHESDSESPGSKSQLELEFANQKWVELQFEDDNTINEVYGYNIEYERPPLEDIKEEDTDDLQSSKVGSIGSQVSHSIDSFGSMKESFSSTPESKKYLGKSLENDNISVNSLQEFERLEQLVRIESMKAKSSGSLASTTSSSNSKKDDLSLASLKDFETIEAACFKTELIENKALATEKSLDDEDGMFKINEIIKEAVINLEQNEDNSEKHLSEDDNLTSTESLDLKTIVTDMKVSASLEHMSNTGFVEGKQNDYDDCMNSSVSSRGFSSPIMDDHSKESSYRNSLILGSNDSLGPISSTSTNATYHCETGSNMSSSFTSGGSNTMVSSMEGLDKTGSKHDWFDEHETFETFRKDQDGTEFTHKVIRMPAEMHKVTAKGPDKDKIIEDFVEYFSPGEFQEDVERTDEHGNVFVTRIVQKRMVFDSEELASKGVSEDELNECLRKLSKDAPSGFEISKKTSTHIAGSSEEIKEPSKYDTKQELQVAASKPELKCEISMDDDTEIDLREHDWRFQHQINTETDDITKPSTSGWTGKSKPKENVSEL